MKQHRIEGIPVPPFAPCDGNILIADYVASQRKVGSILIPDSARETDSVRRVVVLRVGPGELLREKGNELCSPPVRLPVGLEPGQHVLVSRHGPYQVDWSGRTYYFLPADTVIATIDPPEDEEEEEDEPDEVLSSARGAV